MKIVKNIKIPIACNSIFLKENLKKNAEDTSVLHQQPIKEKISSEDFLRKYEKVINKSIKLLNMAIEKESVYKSLMQEFCFEKPK